MITEQNKWVVIEAYLAGQLDESGRQEVTQKMTDDTQFQADVLMQLALNQHLEHEQEGSDYALVDTLLQEESVRKPRPGPVPPTQWWRQTWVQGVTLLLLVILAGASYTLWPRATVFATRITYEQRDLGLAGTPDTVRPTTFPVEFQMGESNQWEYSIGADGLHIYLDKLPPDVAEWRLRDEPKTGGFLLITPQGETYRLDHDTYGHRKLLRE